MANDRHNHPRLFTFADAEVPETAMRALPLLQRRPKGYFRAELARELGVPAHLAGVALWWLRDQGYGVDCGGRGFRWQLTTCADARPTAAVAVSGTAAPGA